MTLRAHASTSTNAAAKLSAAVGIVQQLREGVDELRRNRAFQSILGVTIIGNFWFVGPFFPVVHVLNRRCDGWFQTSLSSLSPTFTLTLLYRRCLV